MTPEGVLYEKEAILECLLNQKKEYARKLALYNAAAAGEAREAEAAARAAEEARLEQFHRMNSGGGPLPGGAGAAATPQQASAASGELRAFWVPSTTPQAASHAEKPSSDTLCPATGKKLRMKELTPVHFTRVPGDVPEEGGGRFMCPSCKEVSRALLCLPALARLTPPRPQTFTNVSRIVVLKCTGDALCEGCYTRFVVPDGTGAHAARACRALVRWAHLRARSGSRATPPPALK